MMAKKTLNLEDLLKQKNELQADFDKVKTKLQEIDSMKTQLTAQANALSGAIQQTDQFIGLISESSPDSSIPSQDDSAISTALS
jgi:predicted nuclease with TOPRIM domain